jgi:phenylalanyl-tRNA synthetase beta chain
MSGPRQARHWSASEGALDFFDLKGIVDALCATFRVKVTYVPGRHSSLHPGRTSEVCLEGKRLGVLGQLHPTLAERFDLGAHPVLVAELDFDQLAQAGRPLPNVRTPSRFPPSDRDISFFIDASTPHVEIEAVIREAAGDLLESLELFDVFTGGGVPPGRQSLAFSLRYRAPDRTLNDEEVSLAHARVERALQAHFGAEVRGRV